MQIRPYRLLGCALALVLAAGTVSAGQRNVHIDADEPSSCADIDVEFDDRPALRSEDRVSVPAGGTLRLEAAENSGVYVREDARSDFEVVLCKAAPKAAALAEIALSRSGERIGVSGPSRGEWAGFPPRLQSARARGANG